MARLPFCPLILLPALFSACLAAEPDPAGLLADFEKAGFPDLRNARYIALDDPHQVGAGGLFNYDMESGDAWLLGETAATNGGPARIRIVINGGCAMTADVLEKIGYGEQAPRRPAVQGWTAVEPARDFRRALWLLNSLAVGKTESPYDWDTVVPRLFLFALALQQRGDAASARTLMTALQAQEESWPAVLQKARDILREQQYRSLFFRFSETGDWLAFRDGMKALLASEGPRNWDRRSEVAQILSGAEAAIRGETNTPAGFSERENMLARELLKAERVKTHADYQRQDILWLVPASWTNALPPGNDPDLRIRALGLKALPLLVALSDDEAYTRIPLQNDRFNPGRTRVDLPRPMTRGEAALAILKELLPAGLTKGRNSFEDRDPDELVEAATAFYTENKDKTDEQVAGLFLFDSSEDSSPGPALAYLQTKAAAGPVPLLEEYLLKGGAVLRRYSFEPASLDRVDELIRYGAARGKAVESLARQMADLLERDARDYTKPENVSYGDEEANEKHVREVKVKLTETAARVRALEWEASNDRLVTLWIEGDSAASSFTNTLLQCRLESLPPREAFRFLLERAARESEPKARMRVAGRASALLYVKPAAIYAAPTEYPDQWKTLLADTREWEGRRVCDTYLVLQEKLFGRSRERGPRNNDLTELYRAEDHNLGRMNASSDVMALINAYGEEGRALAQKRALARLAGTPEERLPPFPAASDVDAAGWKKVAATLASVKSRAEAESAVRALSLSERIGLAGMLTNDPALNRALAPYALTVTNIVVEGDPVLAKLLKSWMNKPADANLVRLLQDVAASQTRLLHSVTASLERGENFGGCVVRAVPYSPEKEKDKDKKGTWKMVGTSGQAAGSGFYGAADWRLFGKPAPDRWGEFDSSLPDARRDFEKAAREEFFGERPAASSAGFVVFQTQWRTE